MFDGLLCFKSEYHTESGKMEVFNEGGESLAQELFKKAGVPHDA